MKLSPQLVQQMLERQPSFARELSQIFAARRQLIQEIRG
jgi:hypothetical protein